MSPFNVGADVDNKVLVGIKDGSTALVGGGGERGETYYSMNKLIKHTVLSVQRCFLKMVHGAERATADADIPSPDTNGSSQQLALCLLSVKPGITLPSGGRNMNYNTVPVRYSFLGQGKVAFDRVLKKIKKIKTLSRDSSTSASLALQRSHQNEVSMEQMLDCH